MIPLPPATIWEQFAIIAVIVLVLAMLGIAGRAVFREFTKYQTDQTAQRQIEQEKQRQWEESRDSKLEADRKERDKSWQSFFERINGENSDAICAQTEATQRIVEQMKAIVPGIEAIMARLSEHDTWAHKIVEEKRADARRRKIP